MSGKSQLIYQPLEDASLQIRLLKCVPIKLAPESVSADEQCLPFEFELCTFSLRDAQAQGYHALSYTWGAVHPQYLITIDGATLHIRQNLWQYFLALDDQATCDKTFLYPPPYFLWIDQISIDQSNDEEKCLQIPIMGEIYGGASRVIAWLGPEGADSNAAQQWLFSLKTSPVPHGQIESIHDTETGSFLGRSYWSRLWILQELKLAKDLMFQCGNWVFSAQEMAIAAKNSEYFEDERVWYWNAFFWPVVRDKDKQKQHQLGSWRELLSSVYGILYAAADWEWKCVEPQDRIFGLIAMVEPRQRISANYSWTLEHLAGVVLFQTFEDKTVERILRGEPEVNIQVALQHLHREYTLLQTVLKLPEVALERRRALFEAILMRWPILFAFVKSAEWWKLGLRDYKPP